VDKYQACKLLTGYAQQSIDRNMRQYVTWLAGTIGGR